jgi:hypothetical protein
MQVGRVGILLGCIVAAMAPVGAEAAMHKVCVDFELGPELWDASPRPDGPSCTNNEECTALGFNKCGDIQPRVCQMDPRDFGEVYGRWEGERPFVPQRWLARVHEANGLDLWGWAPLDEGGCTGEFETSATHFDVYWTRWAVWSNGNQTVGYTCDSMDNCEFEFLEEVLALEAETQGDPLITNVTITGGELNDIEDRGSLTYAFWAATFSEERASYHDDLTTLVAYDPTGDFQDGTKASRYLGGYPGLVVKGEGYHSKFVCSHEKGHVETALAPIPAFSEADIDYGYNMSPSHTWESEEYQAVALVEGMANLYALSVWHDLDQPGPNNGVDAATTADLFGAKPVPHSGVLSDPVCDTCPAGVGNEWDWASALRVFIEDVEPPLALVFEIIEAVYDEGWVASGTTSAFWTNFDAAMQTHLGSDYGAWLDIAEEWGLDR